MLAVVEFPKDAWKLLLSHTPFPAWHADSDAFRDFFNPAWTKFTGRRAEQDSGDGWLEDIYQEDRENHVNIYREAVRAGKGYRVESRIRHADGGYRVIAEIGIPLSIDSEVQGYIGFLEDLTEVKRLRAQLDSAYSRTRIMGDHIPLPSISLDSEGRILSWNLAAEAATGYSLFEVLGKNVRMLIPERHAQKVLAKIAEIFDQAILGENGKGAARVKVLTRGGTEVLMEAHYAAARTEDGPTLFAILIEARADNTGSVKMVEDADLLKLAFQKMPTPIAIVTQDGKIQHISDSAAAILGYDSTTLLGKDITELAEPDGAPDVAEDVKSVLHNDIQSLVDRRFKTKAGEIRTLRVAYAPVRDPNGRIPYIFVQFADISQAKNLEEDLRAEITRLQSELEARMRELDELHSSLPEAERLMSAGMAVAQAAHDVRNPLTAIDLGLYALENMSPDKDKEEISKIISTMRTAVKQANDVISDLSQYVRPKPARKVAIKVRDLIKESLKMLTIPENIRVEDDMVEPSLVVHGDRAELTRVFQNLAKNAIEAMKDGGTGGVLKFWTEQREGYTCICVTDTGKGMDPDTLKKLFSPFFTTKEHGLGLGLTVVKRFVEDHGGKVEAESVPGKGTTFKVLLPTQVQTQPQQQTQQTSQRAEKAQH